MKNQEIIDNLVLLHRAFCGFYNDIQTKGGNRLLCGVQATNVHLLSAAFHELFGLSDTIGKRNCDTYPYEVSIMHKNVKFITLLSAESAKELYNVE